MTELMQVLTTMPDREGALAMARDLVERRLAACVQLGAEITSVYRWEGVIHEEPEVPCVVKVPSDRLDPLLTALRRGHPYDTPELTVVPAAYTDERYLGWAVEETTPG